MLVLIKLLHTLIWTVMAGAVFYILYAAVAGQMDIWLWSCIGLVLMESLVLLLNRWTCPLTPWAARYTDERQDNFDIYLPRWIARHNKTIFGSLFALGVIIVLIRVVAGL